MKVSIWEGLQNVTNFMITQGFTTSSNQDTKVFDEFSRISNYVKGEKITSWNAKNVAAEKY